MTEDKGFIPTDSGFGKLSKVKRSYSISPMSVNVETNQMLEEVQGSDQTEWLVVKSPLPGKNAEKSV